METIPELIILTANPQRTYSNDKYYKYRANTNMVYYTGIDEPEVVLILMGKEKKSVLYCREKNPTYEQWHGKLLGLKKAADISGVSCVYPLEELQAFLEETTLNYSEVYFSPITDSKLDGTIKKALAKTRIKDPTPYIHRQRVIKSEGEIKLLKRAASITASSHLEILKRPLHDLTELQIEAMYIMLFQVNGARLPTHQGIVASGENSIMLHHSASTKKVLDGELILVDIGAEYKHYTADVTRTWPISGKFNKEQKQLYQIVLKAHKECLRMIRPGIAFWDIHRHAVKVLTQGLLDIGLLKGSVQENIEQGSYKRYFMHGIGHWLGIDIHDCGSVARHEAILQEGHVLTIEPGLYIPTSEDIPPQYRGIGIRIEDDVVVTPSGCEVLSKDCPIEIEEIEEIIASLALPFQLLRKVKVIPYKEEWKNWFSTLQKWLGDALGNNIVRIEHVGSTAVEGLAAKPVIDIDIVIEKEKFNTVRVLLQGLGYLYQGDRGINGREAFHYKGEQALPPHHLYVCDKNSNELINHLAFRDFLRKNTEWREKYSRIKIDLALKYPHNRDAYISGKDEICKQILKQALAD